MDNTSILRTLQSTVGSAKFSQWSFQRWSFYDYSVYPGAGTNSLSMFSTPLGGSDPYATAGSSNKTLEDTNLQKGRSFGQVYYFIKEVRTHIRPATKNRQPSAISGDVDLLGSTWQNLYPELYNLMTLGVLKISIGQKEYYDIQRPFTSAPPGFGIDVVQPYSLTTYETTLQQDNRATNTYALEGTQMIEPDMNFSVEFQWPNGSPAVLTNLVNSATPLVKLGVIFDGYIARPLQ